MNRFADSSTPRPIRHHHIDLSCEIDREFLDASDAEWEFRTQLVQDMTECPLDYLISHYPELTFGRAKVKSEKAVKKRDHDFVERKGGITTWADWRKGRN